MLARNMQWDLACSAKIPPGVVAEMYDHDGFAGPKSIVTGGNWYTNDQEMTCIDLKEYGACDNTASIKLYSLVNSPANGYWKGYTGSEDIKVEITQGFSSTNTQSTTTTMQYTLAFEMHTGVEFSGASISSEFSQGIEQMVEDTFTMDISITQYVECTQCEVGTGTGLW